MKITSIIFVFLFSFSTFLSAQSLQTFYNEADIFMNNWVKEGNINYKKLKDNFSEIEKLHKQIADADLSNASENEKKSFYINAYNLLVIYQVTKNYPLKSALDRSGFFDKFNHKVAGETVTLDRIEKKYLILKYRDPRIHFAVSCAAVSCPTLASFAFKPAQLDKQLEERTKFALNLDFVVKLDKTGNNLSISKIFDWYAVDFGKSNENLVSYINKYRTDKIPLDIKLNYLEYNWALNSLTD